MAALVGLFGNTDYVKNLMGGHNIIIGCCLMVGINAVCEMVSSTVITGAVGAALSKAHLILPHRLAVRKQRHKTFHYFIKRREKKIMILAN